ncbi:hypothetical protein HWV62_25420 [Athelia sp. TMB]|nr:hypothetical protein HWV62_25420 [Athelia sp. TMB]
MQFFKSTLFVAVAFAATLVAASPAPAPADCPWQEYGQACTYNSDCACLNKCIASNFSLVLAAKPSPRCGDGFLRYGVLLVVQIKSLIYLPGLGTAMGEYRF